MLLRQLERHLTGLPAFEISSDVRSDPGEGRSRSTDQGLLNCGPVAIDCQRHKAFINKQELDLTPTEFHLLMTLVDRAPAVVSPQTLLREATGYQADLAEARELVKWHIHRLRGKVERDPRQPQVIINVRGVGYRLAAS
jgi:DNA-binding response OmpR family regulator